ncbi:MULTISPECIES: hypothetical protein [Arthrobacter]|uniref:DUF998 domain-containing protein n=1 Tax=Arthrobacter humicola TaxID=409291 RepID=A0ABP5LF50_9MICC|nr:hypothetical protein [Arthrobacter sp. H-02-3]PVZ54062.1 hypothetical protein C9424_16305 [Arthrobacter sp. H-02-3]
MVDTAAPALRTGVGRDLVTELLGIWLLLAVFLDGWAHLHVPGLETFFTPWHAALYSGLLAMAAWTATVIWRNREPGQPLARAIPAGYRGTVVGVVLFAVAGVLDLAWHEILGIEVSLDALVSPTHLLLGFSLFLILGTGVRSARARGRSGAFEWSAPALLAVALMTGLGAFFLIYCSAFVRTAPAVPYIPTPIGSPGHTQAEMPAAIGMASYLVTTALIIAPFLYTWSGALRPPRGIATMLVAVVAWLPLAMSGFRPAGVAGAAGATLAAVVADVLIARGGGQLTGRRLPAVSAVLAALIWTGQMIGIAVVSGVGWPVSMWLGAIVLSSAVAAGLAFVSSWNTGSTPTQEATHV